MEAVAGTPVICGAHSPTNQARVTLSSSQSLCEGYGLLADQQTEQPDEGDHRRSGRPDPE